ncbi:MAG: hypothetical protein ACRDLM_10320 [Gaiellaceae bacterium]
MTRLRALLFVGVVVALAVTSAASGRRTQPVLRRPNPLFVSLGLDYVNPIPAPGGGYALFDPQARPVVNASVRDLRFLEYENRGDLGGFIAAPKGWLAIGTCRPKVNLGDKPCPGVTLTGVGGKSQIDFYSNNQVGNKINSYTWLHGFGGGKNKCAACGTLVPPSPFPSNTPLPGPNQGFGGLPKPPKKPTTPVTVGNNTGDCGTKGISIVSNLPKCRIYVVNQEPGDGTFEKMKITNTTSVPYILSLHATGTPNRLWQDLEMGIWVKGQPAPSPLPPLHFWTAQYNEIQVLQPGEVANYLIELYLPLSAGNADQKLPAIIDFNWRAIEKTSA